MRNMSFALTTPQFIDGSKDVTRRFGWWFLKAGDQVRAVEKSMGIPKGHKIRPLGIIEVYPRIEPLRAMVDDLKYGESEVVREGFPDMSPAQFVEMLCDHYKILSDKECNRIEFIRREPCK